MKYLKPEEILNNPDYIPVVPKTGQVGESLMSRITHFTRVPSNNEWDNELYYR